MTNKYHHIVGNTLFLGVWASKGIPSFNQENYMEVYAGLGMPILFNLVSADANGGDRPYASSIVIHPQLHFFVSA